jgi:hypothetical protein
MELVFLKWDSSASLVGCLWAEYLDTREALESWWLSSGFLVALWCCFNLSLLLGTWWLSSGYLVGF